MALSSPFRKEPPPPQEASGRTAILLCNLGTPDAPTPGAVRRYLAEFLSDPRVVEIPRVLWLPLLYGLILPLRAGQSAAKYRSIWTPDGSPLQVWTTRQAKLLQGWLGEQGHRVRVCHAMRYGRPGIAEQLDALKAGGATRILVLPVYPQYSGTTTASVVDAVNAWTGGARRLPELRFVMSYHDEPAYIKAVARGIEQHWRANGRPDHLVMSFHGVPARTRDLGDPYAGECERTARLLAAQLMLQEGQYTACYQSRFGKARWLEPYTEPSLRKLGAQGKRRVDVVCPGFAVDCLETLEEIAIEGRAAFIAAGGKEFHYLPCLNDDPAGIAALGAVALRHLAGWPTQVGAATAAMGGSR